MSSLKQRAAIKAKSRAKLTPQQRAKKYDTRFVWSLMHARCSDPKNAAYKYYGGRGVKVCRRWKKYDNFLSDMGKKPVGCWIDLKDNSRNFTPKNSYWATREEQNKNRALNLAMAATAKINPDLYKILKRAIALKRRRKLKRKMSDAKPKRKTARRRAD